MNTKIRTALAGLALASIIPAASAGLTSTLNFDDLPTGDAPFSSAYQGWTFGNGDASLGSWWHSDANVAINPGSGAPESHRLYHSASTSVSTIAFDQQGLVYLCTDVLSKTGDLCESAPITSATPSVVNGAWFRSLDNQVRVALELWYQGSIVYTTGVETLDYDTEVFLATNYSGAVDKVVVLGDQGFYAMDDLTVSDVPVPATLGLLFAGLGALVSTRRRTESA